MHNVTYSTDQEYNTHFVHAGWYRGEKYDASNNALKYTLYV